eukprot:6200609-Pleurochrysis_carterae.AAC.2
MGITSFSPAGDNSPSAASRVSQRTISGLSVHVALKTARVPEKQRAMRSDAFARLLHRSKSASARRAEASVGQPFCLLGERPLGTSLTAKNQICSLAYGSSSSSILVRWFRFLVLPLSLHAKYR